MKSLLLIIFCAAFCFVAKAEETKIFGKAQPEIYIDAKRKETIYFWTIFEVHGFDHFFYSIEEGGEVFSKGEVSISQKKVFSKDRDLFGNNQIRIDVVLVEKTGERFVRFAVKQSLVSEKAVMIITLGD